jgi:protein TonB
MTALLPTTQVETPWLAAIGLAAAAHVVAISAVLVARGEAAEIPPEAVMVVELPASAAPAASALAAVPLETSEPAPELPTMVTPRLVVPDVAAPLPEERVAIPVPQPLPRAVVAPAARPAPVPRAVPTAPVARIAPAPDAAGSAAAAGGPGQSAEAKEEEADWYSLISAHLERNKRYPREAKAAEQQGTPMVRFAVDRRGRVSDVSISRSSGHDLLDEATLDLLRRVSPLPAMPRSMGHDRVVVSLPIEYSLSRK